MSPEEVWLANRRLNCSEHALRLRVGDAPTDRLIRTFRAVTADDPALYQRLLDQPDDPYGWAYQLLIEPDVNRALDAEIGAWREAA
jgi:hypothetical protein